MKTRPQLLSYYSSVRCSAEDTQNLYLGLEEMKPLLSIINKIQINMKEQELLAGKDISITDKLSIFDEKEEDIKYLSEKLIDLLRKDVIMDLKSKKLV